MPVPALTGSSGQSVVFEDRRRVDQHVERPAKRRHGDRSRSATPTSINDPALPSEYLFGRLETSEFVQKLAGAGINGAKIDDKSLPGAIIIELVIKAFIIPD